MVINSYLGLIFKSVFVNENIVYMYKQKFISFNIYCITYA